MASLLLYLVTSGCSIRQLAINSLANALVSGSGVYTSDNDPELVRHALPFTLKMMETVLAETPGNKELLLATCQGFTQYSYAFVALELERLRYHNYRKFKEQRERALNLYLRARDYCLQALDLTVAGTSQKLGHTPDEALDRFGKRDVPLLFWSGTSWGAAIALGLRRPNLVADAPAIRALFERALELDPRYGNGALLEAMIVLDSLPEAMNGSLQRARQHYDQALELHGGRRASTYVIWAEMVSKPQKNRKEFVYLLQTALDIDPEEIKSERLVALIARKRAQLLLDLRDEYDFGEE